MSTDPRVAIVNRWTGKWAAKTIVAGFVADAAAEELLEQLDAAPQPIVLPSVDEVREVLRQSEGRFLAVAAQAVLDLIASRVPVWVPIEPGAFIGKGTRVRYEDGYTRSECSPEVYEYTWPTDGPCTKHATTNSRLYIDPRAAAAEPELDPAVERVAKAIHDADSEPYAEQWTRELEGVRETYRRLARAAMAAIA